MRPLAVLGERWTLVLLRQSFAGIRRFEDFQSTLGLSRSRLAERLRLLVDEGILDRVAYNESATRYEYRLTDKGRALYPVLMALAAWGDEYLAPDGPPALYRHRDCGGHVAVRLECDRCGAELTARDVETAAGPGAAAAPGGAATYDALAGG